jgi:hypothetical protein
MQRRRRRSLVAGTALSVAVAGGMMFSLASFGGADLAEAAVSRAKSLVDLLDQRSPGARTEAELTKTKHAKEALADREPRIIPKNLAEVLAPPVSALVPVDIDAAAPITVLASALPPGIIVAPPPGVFVTPPGGGVIIPPGGGGKTPPPGPPSGPPNTPPPGPPDTPPPGPPPLPEPGTWMTMILGFGVVGWLLRRDRAACRSRLTA